MGPSFPYHSHSRIPWSMGIWVPHMGRMPSLDHPQFCRQQNLLKNSIWFKVSYIIWVFPLPGNSHHQDYYIFSRGSRTKPSFATVTGRRDNPIYNIMQKTLQSKKIPTDPWNIPQTLNYLFMFRKSFHSCILGYKKRVCWPGICWNFLRFRYQTCLHWKTNPRDPQVREELRERRTGLPCDQRQRAEAREIESTWTWPRFWKGTMSFAKWNLHFWVQHVCVYMSVSDLSQLGMLLNSQPENENSMALRDVLVGRGLCIWRFQPWENDEDLRIWPETQWSQWLGYKKTKPLH